MATAAADPGEATRELTEFRRDVQAIIDEVGRRIVGHVPIIEGVVTALLAGGHVLLEGVPGVGKTLLVRTLADAIALSFARIQFTPDLMPSDVTGTNLIVDAPSGRRFEFQKGPIFAHLVLADEINRATPKTQSALLEAMQEHAVTTGRTTLELPSPFLVLATQNPIEMEGTYPLPEAQLDRFFFKLRVSAPTAEELHAILDRTTGPGLPEVTRVLQPERVLEMRRLIRDVPVARPIQDYVVRLVRATHPDTSSAQSVRKYVRYGASPRGAQAMLLGSKVLALRAGRYTPGIEDVRRVAAEALRHRLLLNYEGEADGVSTDRIIGELLDETPDV